MHGEPRRPGPGLSILLVDDSPIYLRTASAYLRERDGIATVEEAASGPEALEAIERRRPDVVLLDLAMPRMNGFEVARRIKARPRPPRVVIVTIHEPESLGRAAAEAGADALFAKQDFGPRLLDLLRALFAPGAAGPGA